MRLHENIYKVLGSTEKVKLLKLLLSGKEIPDMSERELARLVKTSNASVNRAMADFNAINLVSYKRTGSSHVWSVKKNSFAYSKLKNIIEIISIGGIPYDTLIDLIKKELETLPVIKAVIFGSVSRQEERENSDIDLFVLVKDEKDREKFEKRSGELITKCIEMFGNVLVPYVMTQREYAGKSKENIVAEINKGIKII